MIRKGIRPRIRPALDRPGSQAGYRRVFPFRRSWIAIGVVAAFDIVFLIPAITTFQEAAGEWGRLDDLFDLVSALFLSAWLLGWSIAPLALTTVLALMLFGREVITARAGRLVIFIGLPGIGLAAEYGAASVRNLRLESAPRRSGRAWRGAHLAFEYGANKVAFGSDLDKSDAADIVNHLRMASGAAVRTGEATPEELAGDWGPDPLAAADAEPEKPAPAEPAADGPVTLTSPSTLVLILANLVPLFGAVLLGWDLGYVMVLYWAESAVIGFFNVCKIAVVSRWLALLSGPFFIGHFGAFMAVHFLFIYGLFIQGPGDMSGGDLGDVARLFKDLWPALAALCASHAVSFFTNFLGRQEFRGRTLRDQMTEPYSRIVFMHLVLIFGGGLTLVLGEPAPVLLLVIGLKIWLDIRAHLAQRKRRKLP